MRYSNSLLVYIVLILFIIALASPSTVTVTTCCDSPLSSNNISWCDGMYSQSEQIQFKYGALNCKEENQIIGSFNAGSVWEGDGFFPDYFLKYKDRFYSPNDYCLKELNDEKIQVKICSPQCQEEVGRLCLPKCCNLWDDVSFVNNTVYCVPSFEEKVWKPEIHDRHDYYTKVAFTPDNFHFYVNDPSKSESTCTTVRLIRYQHFDYKILNNGQVTWTSSEVLDWFRIPEGRFCLDREVGGESTGVDGGSSVVTEVLVGCLEDFIPRINDSLTLVDTINFALTQISLAFLALTLIVYVLLRGHQNVHSWTQFSYFFALWSNLLLASVIYFQTQEETTKNLQVSNEGAGQQRGSLCFLGSVLSTFLHNATLTTMVALGVDVFAMFHQLLKTGEQPMPKSEFAKRQILAWGSALVMTLIGLTLYYSNGSMHSPAYGYVNCKAKFWLADEILEAVCHLLTATLFLITVIRIGLVRFRGKEEMMKISEQRNYSRALCLFFKLLMIMGMSWGSILLSFLFVKSAAHAVKWIFTLAEFSISLQGFVIFLLFAFNRKTLETLGENYSIIRKLSNASSTSSSSSEKQKEERAISDAGISLEDGVGVEVEASRRGV